MRFLYLILLSVLVLPMMSCSSKVFDYKNLLGKPVRSANILVGNATYYPKSNVIKAIFKTPSVSRTAEELSIARSRIKLIAVQGNTQIVSTGAFGILDEYNTESKGVGYGTLKAERIFTDNQRLKNSKKLARLDEESKKIDLILEFNRKLQEEG